MFFESRKLVVSTKRKAGWMHDCRSEIENNGGWGVSFLSWFFLGKEKKVEGGKNKRERERAESRQRGEEPAIAVLFCEVPYFNLFISLVFYLGQGRVFFRRPGQETARKIRERRAYGERSPGAGVGYCCMVVLGWGSLDRVGTS